MGQPWVNIKPTKSGKLFYLHFSVGAEGFEPLAA